MRSGGESSGTDRGHESTPGTVAPGVGWSESGRLLPYAPPPRLAPRASTDAFPDAKRLTPRGRDRGLPLTFRSGARGRADARRPPRSVDVRVGPVVVLTERDRAV